MVKNAGPERVNPKNNVLPILWVKPTVINKKKFTLYGQTLQSCLIFLVSCISFKLWETFHGSG